MNVLMLVTIECRDQIFRWNECIGYDGGVANGLT